MTTAADVIREARSWVKTPFRHQGRIKGIAVDCGGLVSQVGRAVGLTTADPLDYSPQPDPARMRELLDRYLVRIAIADMRPGDVVWIAWRPGTKDVLQHLGILTDIGPDLGVVHAYGTNGRGGTVIEHRLDVWWRGRIRAAYRFPGLEA